jgi:uncharacterized membrane protein YphA (DoxX/SURF4 family)
MVYGIQQIIIQDFRPQILPPFPAWSHQYYIFAIATGVAMIVFGIIVTGLVRFIHFNPAKLCIYLGFYFLALIITCHIPYLLFIFPHKLYHLGVWADLLKELAFSGGSFVMAAPYWAPSVSGKNKSFAAPANRVILAGRLFFCTTMVLFGWSHFVYNEAISEMVPGWFGMPKFWAYFGGVALIAAGVAIGFKIFIKPVSLLLALMLFLWFILLHVPGAIRNPAAGRGNSIVSAFDALLFCGTALVLSQYRKITANKAGGTILARDAKKRIIRT